MLEPDAQKKEIEKEEPLQDLTPEDDVVGGGHVKAFRGLDGNDLTPDAQKKEIGGEI